MVPGVRTRIIQTNPPGPGGDHSRDQRSGSPSRRTGNVRRAGGGRQISDAAHVRNGPAPCALSMLPAITFVETVHRVQDGSYRLTDGWDSENRLA